MRRPVVRAGVVLAVCGSCAGRPGSSAPATRDAIPKPAGAARSESRAPEPRSTEESFPRAYEPTWPNRTYGSDAVLAPLPASCGRVARRPRVACSAGDQPLRALAETLRAQPDVQRDERLWALEACDQFPAGFIRQVRAELFIACAPTIADLGAAESSKLPAEARATLHAFVFANRLERFGASAAQPLVDEVTPKVADDYVARYLAPWLNERVAWLKLQEAVPAHFAQGSYARAVALFALAEAWAKLKSASAVRPPKLGGELTRDYERRKEFYGKVDEATRELKAAGREVSRQALDAVAWQGMTLPHFGRVWLGAAHSSAAGTTRSTPLFRLLLPRLELAENVTPLQQVVESLPPYYAVELVSADDLADRATLASLLVQGLAPKTRQSLMATAKPDQLWALAQLRVRLGILTHQRQQFEWAAEHLRRLDDQRESELLMALADTLRHAQLQAAAGDEHPPSAFSRATLAPLVNVAEHGATALNRALARANVGELAWWGAAPVSQLEQGYKDLSDAYSQLEGTPLASCVAESMADKAEARPFSRAWPCDSYRPENPRKPERLYFGACGSLGWQQQRRLETPVTLDELCER